MYKSVTFKKRYHSSDIFCTFISESAQHLITYSELTNNDNDREYGAKCLSYMLLFRLFGLWVIYTIAPLKGSKDCELNKHRLHLGNYGEKPFLKDKI